MQFVMTHYYDTVDHMGNSVSSTYAQATAYTITSNIEFDQKITGAMILPAYKTIYGGGYSYTSTWLGSTTNQIEGAVITTGDSSTSTAANSVSDTKYPASVVLEGNTNVKYYGISDFISLSYGTIRNLNVVINNISSQSFNYHYYTGLDSNVSYGAIAGISLGAIYNCTVTISRDTTYSVGTAGAQSVVAMGVGINVGTISELTTTLNSLFMVRDTYEPTSGNSYSGNIILGGAIGINGKTGVITGLSVVNNGTMQIGTSVEGTESSSISGNAYYEKDVKINSVTVGGLVAINAGGALHYSTISGSGAFIINSKHYTNVTVQTLDENNQVVSETAVTTYYNLLDIQYLHFAIGVALANNTATTPDYNTGVTVYQNVSNGTNLIDHMLIDYLGNVQYYSNHYMVGLAFAKASASTNVNSSSLMYNAIFWNELYNSDIELYTSNSTYAADSNISVTSASAGLSLMGWVDATSIVYPVNFISGAQIEANVTDLTLSWVKSNGAYTGNILMTTSETGMKSKNPFALFDIEYLPSATVKQTILNNNSYYTFTQGASQSTILFNVSNLISNDVIINTNLDTYKGNALRIDITFNYPHVEINDVYQLAQFLWFDSSDANSIADYYLRTYINNILLLIDNNLKKATATNPYGAWITLTDSNVESVLAHYSDGEYYIYYYSSKATYYYIFLEKYYDEDGDEILYYAANSATLGDNISLDRFGNATPDFGFDTTSWKEFPATKSLDGQGYTIELIVEKYATTSFNAMPTTSKWYINNGSDSNNNTVSEQWLDDVADTPSYNQTTFIFGGFIGINRGTISNINFVYREGAILNIAGDLSHYNDVSGDNADAFYKVLDRHVFFGMVCGYSTGTQRMYLRAWRQFTSIYS